MLINGSDARGTWGHVQDQKRIASNLADAHRVFQSIWNLAEELGYCRFEHLNTAVAPYFSLWRHELAELTEGIETSLYYRENMAEQYEALIQTSFITDVKSQLASLSDIDKQVHSLVCEEYLTSVFKRSTKDSDSELRFLGRLEDELKTFTSKIIKWNQYALWTIAASLIDGKGSQSKSLPSPLESLSKQDHRLNMLVIRSETCSDVDGALVLLDELDRMHSSISDVSIQKKCGDAILTLRIRFPELGPSSSGKATMGQNQCTGLAAVLAYSDVLRLRIVSLLELLSTLEKRIIAEAELPSQDAEAEVVSEEQGVGTLEKGTHGAARHDRANKTLLVLDMLTMHNFRKLPSISQLRTLEYEVSSMMKDCPDAKRVGDMAWSTTLDNMMEAFVRQCWRKRTNLQVLNANPMLLQLCLDSLLIALSQSKGMLKERKLLPDQGEISLVQIVLSARECVCMGVLAVLLRYSPNAEKLDLDSILAVLLSVLCPGSPSKGLDLIRGFACAHCLTGYAMRYNSNFVDKVVEFGIHHLASTHITWGLATEICGFFASLLCGDKKEPGCGYVQSISVPDLESSAEDTRYRDMTAAIVISLDTLAVPSKSSRVSSMIFCEYGIRALTALARNGAAHQIVASNGIQVALRIMNRCPRNALAQKECCELVKVLALASDPDLFTEKAEGFAEFLLETTRAPWRDKTVVDSALRTLIALTFRSLQIRSQVINTLHLVMPVLQQLGTSGSATHAAAAADLLCNLSCPIRTQIPCEPNSASVQCLVDFKVPQHLVSIMEVHTDKKRLVCRCVQALANISIVRHGCEAIALLHAEKIISSVISTYLDNPSLLQAGMFLIGRLTACSEKCKKELQALGVIQTIQDALLRHPDDPLLARCCQEAIISFRAIIHWNRVKQYANNELNSEDRSDGHGRDRHQHSK